MRLWHSFDPSHIGHEFDSRQKPIVLIICEQRDVIDYYIWFDEGMKI